MRPRLRICVATSYAATAEPRAARYTAALARMDPRIEIVFVDCVPRGQEAESPAEFAGLPNVSHHTWYFPWRGHGRLRLLWEKTRLWQARRAFRRAGTLRAAGLSTRCIGLEKRLIAVKADIYFGFNIDSLLPVFHAARLADAPFVFDCQEIYAEMSHGQTETERAMIRAAERLCLPVCALVLAASPQAAEYLESTYAIHNVLPLLNAPPVEDLPPDHPAGDFTLYWRNSTVDLGPRGLDDALEAMKLLPAGITLFLQGRAARAGGDRVGRLIRDLAIGHRVTILPPYRPEEAVRVAARYSVGLALEQAGSTNADLTTSNKFFDYAMAGLAIVSTGTKALRPLIESAGLGLVYEAGNAADLARQVLRLYEDRALLVRMRHKAREYALREGNLEAQLRLFRDAFRERVLTRLQASVQEELR